MPNLGVLRYIDIVVLAECIWLSCPTRQPFNCFMDCYLSTAVLGRRTICLYISLLVIEVEVEVEDVALKYKFKI